MDFKCLWVVGSKATYFDYCILSGRKENDEKDMYDNEVHLSFVQALVDPDDFANNNGGDSNAGGRIDGFPSLPDNADADKQHDR